MSNIYPICEVTWKDAWTDFTDLSVEEARALKPIVRTTVGYLIDIREDNGIILCTDYYNGEADSINTPICIPFGMISDYRIVGISDNELTGE